MVELGLTAPSNSAFNLNRQRWQERIAEPSGAPGGRPVSSRAFANDPLDLHAQ